MVPDVAAQLMKARCGHASIVFNRIFAGMLLQRLRGFEVTSSLPDASLARAAILIDNPGCVVFPDAVLGSGGGGCCMTVQVRKKAVGGRGWLCWCVYIYIHIYIYIYAHTERTISNM